MEGYDLSACEYSPDGKIHQLDYALKAVETSGNIIAVSWSEGVLIVADREQTSKLHLEVRNASIRVNTASR